MPTPGQISKENLKQILVFFPAVVYNICVVLFSSQLNYTTQKRICPACGLQILFCLLGAFFHSPFGDLIVAVRDAWGDGSEYYELSF